MLISQTNVRVEAHIALISPVLQPCLVRHRHSFVRCILKWTLYMYHGTKAKKQVHDWPCRQGLNGVMLPSQMLHCSCQYGSHLFLRHSCSYNGPYWAPGVRLVFALDSLYFQSAASSPEETNLKLGCKLAISCVVFSAHEGKVM